MQLCQTGGEAGHRSHRVADVRHWQAPSTARRLEPLNASIRRPTTAQSPLALASRAVYDVGAKHLRRRDLSGPRRSVRALDLLIGELERFNLEGGASTSTPEVLGWLAGVEAALDMCIPGWVLSMPDTVRLHAAVLRWQGLLLGACRPDGDEIPDLHEDPIDLLLLPAAAGRLEPVRPRPRRQVA